MRRRRAQERQEFEERINRLEVGLERIESRLRDSGEQLQARLADLGSRVETRLASLEGEVTQAATAGAAAAGAIESRIERDVRPLLLALARDDPGHRRRLHALRESAEYELAYSEPEPLVSVVICAVGNRLASLIGRAVPSALAQTYTNLEVVIVGDAAGAEVRSAVEQLGDPRIRFADLTQPFVHPDPERRWLTASTLPRNEGHAMARGRWIADLDDDDELRPEAIAGLLTLAREQRLEVAYGIMEQVTPARERTRLGRFPPAPQQRAGSQEPMPYERWDGASGCAAVFHAGLRLFAREWVAAEVPAPGDYFRLERMVRAGVRFGMLDEVVYDYYPSLLWERSAVAALNHQP